MNFIFAHLAVRVKFVYEGHRVKVKVTGAGNVHNPYFFRKVNFDRPQLRFYKIQSHQVWFWTTAVVDRMV